MKILINLLLFTTVVCGGMLNRGPYLQQLTDSSVWVLWQMDEPSASGEIQWGTTASYGNTVNCNAGDSVYEKPYPDGTTIYRSEGQITGLNASTIYHYRVICNDDTSGDRWFKTMVDSNSMHFKFAVIGDMHFNTATDVNYPNPTNKALKWAVEQDSVNLILQTGDQTTFGSDDTKNAYADFFKSADSAMGSAWIATTLGNHEANLVEADEYLNTFKLIQNATVEGHKGAYYSFDVGKIHFISLDSDRDALINGNDILITNSDQLAWYLADVRAAEARGQKWFIVFTHQPMYSAGESCYGNHACDYGSRDQQMFFRSYVEDSVRTDLYFAGHSHNYIRFLPLKDTAINDTGVHYYVQGMGSYEIKNIINSSNEAGTDNILAEDSTLGIPVYDGPLLEDWYMKFGWVPKAKTVANIDTSYWAYIGGDYTPTVNMHNLYILVEIDGDSCRTTTKCVNNSTRQVYTVDYAAWKNPSITTENETSIPAFPGADGFGKYSKGGRGGAVYKVTNLNDAGAGSFRAACEATGPRYVVFDTSGICTLTTGPIVIHDSLITIAGQTAVNGFTLFSSGAGGLHTVYMTGDDPVDSVNNIIMRFIRVRGANNGDQGDALRLYNVRNAIIDHCSFSWSSDEVADLSRSQGITLSWNIFTEGITGVDDHNLGIFHCYGRSSRLSMHHNLVSHFNYRLPVYNSDSVDVENNVFYNWRDGGTDIDNFDPWEHVYPAPHRINIVGNFYKKGPESRPSRDDNEPIMISDSMWYYIAGNRYESTDGFTTTTATEMTQNDVSTWNDLEGYFAGTDSVFRQAYSDAYDTVLLKSGCLPHDSLDKKSILETSTGTGVWYNSTPSSAILDDGLTFGKSPTDTDNDGMPDAWETANGLNPNDSNPNSTTLSVAYTGVSGYADLEVYLNELADSLIGVATTANPLLSNLSFFTADTTIEYDVYLDTLIDSTVSDSTFESQDSTYSSRDSTFSSQDSSYASSDSTVDDIDTIATSGTSSAPNTAYITIGLPWAVSPNVNTAYSTIGLSINPLSGEADSTFDTTWIYDTTWNYDTTWSYDTTWTYDSTFNYTHTYDSTIVNDTIDSTITIAIDSTNTFYPDSAVTLHWEETNVTDSVIISVRFNTNWIPIDTIDYGVQTFNYTFPDSSADSGRFKVESGSAVDSSYWFVLNGDGPPVDPIVITVQPQNMTFPFGVYTDTFVYVATNATHIYWTLNGTDQSVDNDSLIFEVNPSMDGYKGVARCWSLGNDTVYSDTFTLTEADPPQVQIDSAYGRVNGVYKKDTVNVFYDADTLIFYGSGFGTEGTQIIKGIENQILVDSSDTMLKVLVIPNVGFRDTVYWFKVINQYASVDSMPVFVYNPQLTPAITVAPENDTVLTGDTVRAVAEWVGTNVRYAWWYYHGGDSTYSYDSVFTKVVRDTNDGDSARLVLWNTADTIASDMIYFRVIHLSFDSVSTSDSLTAYFSGFAPMPDMWTGTIGSTQLTPGVPQLEESLSFTSETKFQVTKRQYRIILSNVQYTIVITFGTGSQRKIFFFFGGK